MNVHIDHNVATDYFDIYVRSGENSLLPNYSWKAAKQGEEIKPFLRLQPDLYEAIANAMLGITHADPNYLKDTQQVRDRLLTLVEKLSTTSLLPISYSSEIQS